MGRGRLKGLRMDLGVLVAAFLDGARREKSTTAQDDGRSGSQGKKRRLRTGAAASAR